LQVSSENHLSAASGVAYTKTRGATNALKWTEPPTTRRKRADMDDGAPKDVMPRQQSNVQPSFLRQLRACASDNCVIHSMSTHVLSTLYKDFS